MKARKLLLLALVVGIGYWIYRTRPTVSGIVDDLTRPIFGSKAAVKESEHKRVEAEAAPAVGRDESVQVGTLKEATRSNSSKRMGWRRFGGSTAALDAFSSFAKAAWSRSRSGRRPPPRRKDPASAPGRLESVCS